MKSKQGFWTPSATDTNRIKRIRRRKSLKYTTRTIASAFPGEQGYVFNRGTRRTDAPGPTSSQPSALSDLFSTIIVRAGAHLAPPTELWTDYNIAYLCENAGRRIPLFQQHTPASPKLEFLGCYRIARWTLCEAQGPDVLAFAEQLRALHPEEAVGEWAQMIARDWAKVQLERVVDPILSGRLHHRYVVRYAWYMASRDGPNVCPQSIGDAGLRSQMLNKRDDTACIIR